MTCPPPEMLSAALQFSSAVLCRYVLRLHERSHATMATIAVVSRAVGMLVLWLIIRQRPSSQSARVSSEVRLLAEGNRQMHVQLKELQASFDKFTD
jgi:hypothetical protein